MKQGLILIGILIVLALAAIALAVLKIPFFNVWLVFALVGGSVIGGFIAWIAGNRRGRR